MRNLIGRTEDGRKVENYGMRLNQLKKFLERMREGEGVKLMKVKDVNMGPGQPHPPLFSLICNCVLSKDCTDIPNSFFA